MIYERVDVKQLTYKYRTNPILNQPLKAWSDRQTDLLRWENGQNMQNLVIR